MAKKFLTLNIGAANVELAEYEAGSKGALTLLNYGVARLAASLDGGDVGTIHASALQEVMQATGIRPGRVAVSISGQLVFPRLAAIPLAGGTVSEVKGIKNDTKFWEDTKIMDAQANGKPMIERRQGLVDRSKTIWALVNPNDYEATVQ